MKPLRWIAAMVISLTMAGCASTYKSSPSTRLGALSSSTLDGVASTGSGAIAVTEVRVVVPDSLIVSEDNSYYPRGDIVWHGDPPGDRHEQVQAIFEDAVARGTGAGSASADGKVPVAVDVEVQRFHSLTPKTRYTFGGIHSIRFAIAVRDAETGYVIEGPRVIKADLKGFGGQKAIEAEHQGQTQRVRITDHLADVIHQEVFGAASASPVQLGFREAGNGF